MDSDQRLGATSLDRLAEELFVLGWGFSVEVPDLFRAIATVTTGDGTTITNTAPTPGRALYWALQGVKGARGER